MKKSIHNITRMSAALMAFAIGLGTLAPVTSCAVQSPDMARTAEEWASLADNNLEYDEIAGLIHEYNPTVISNNYDYQEFVDEYGRTNEEVAKAYRDLADTLADNMEGETDTASGLISDATTELQVKQLRQAADNNTDDAVTMSLGYQQQEANLVMSAKNSFVAYYQSMLTLESEELSLRSLQNTLALTQVMVQAGTATSSDLLTASKNASNQESSVASAREAIEEARQSLIIMFGWDASDQPVIGELPELGAETLDAIDLAADTESALANNYTLRTNERKLENALDEDNIATLNTTIASNKAAIKASVNSAYQTLNNARMSLQTAEASYQTELVNMQIAEAQHAAGTSTQFEYEASQISLEEKELAVESAELSLLTAYITYESYVGGIASTG